MYFVYVILCDDDSLYTGITNNLERRIKEHQTKSGGHYTKSHRSIKLLYHEKFLNKAEAAKREKQIKGWRREKKLNLVKFGKPILK